MTSMKYKYILIVYVYIHMYDLRYISVCMYVHTQQHISGICRSGCQPTPYHHRYRIDIKTQHAVFVAIEERPCLFVRRRIR